MAFNDTKRSTSKNYYLQCDGIPKASEFFTKLAMLPLKLCIVTYLELSSLFEINDEMMLVKSRVHDCISMLHAFLHKLNKSKNKVSNAGNLALHLTEGYCKNTNN